MTTVHGGPAGAGTTGSELLREAAARAVLAPSVHNTQPWRFVIRRNAL